MAIYGGKATFEIGEGRAKRKMSITFRTMKGFALRVDTLVTKHWPTKVECVSVIYEKRNA
jgi:hypothetical protein